MKGFSSDDKMCVSFPRHINTQAFLLNQNPDVGRHAGSEENDFCEEGICSNSLEFLACCHPSLKSLAIQYLCEVIKAKLSLNSWQVPNDKAGAQKVIK